MVNFVHNFVTFFCNFFFRLLFVFCVFFGRGDINLETEMGDTMKRTTGKIMQNEKCHIIIFECIIYIILYINS